MVQNICFQDLGYESWLKSLKTCF